MNIKIRLLMDLGVCSMIFLCKTMFIAYANHVSVICYCSNKEYFQKMFLGKSGHPFFLDFCPFSFVTMIIGCTHLALEEVKRVFKCQS